MREEQREEAIRKDVKWTNEEEGQSRRKERQGKEENEKREKEKEWKIEVSTGKGAK